MEKPYDMSERLLLFAIRMLDVVEALPMGSGATKVKNQLADSGTSIGANYEVAEGAETSADRRNRLVICRKEARETKYWLRIAGHKWARRPNVREDIREVGEIIRILSAMISRLR